MAARSRGVADDLFALLIQAAGKIFVADRLSCSFIGQSGAILFEGGVEHRFDRSIQLTIGVKYGLLAIDQGP